MQAFMCTGPSTGFDPVCDSGDTVTFLVLAVLGLSVVAAILVVVVRRWWRRRRLRARAVEAGGTGRGPAA